jgi:hypothetical protein
MEEEEEEIEEVCIAVKIQSHRRLRFLVISLQNVSSWKRTPVHSYYKKRNTSGKYDYEMSV